MKFTAIGLLSPHWHSVPIDGQVQHVTQDVSFERVPEWLKEIAEDDIAKQHLGEHAGAEWAFCLCRRYEARISEENCDDIPLSDQARRALQNATLMLWLSKRTSFSFDRIVIAAEEECGWVWKELTSHDPRVALPSYMSTDVEPQDFAASHELASKYAQTRPQHTVQTACHALGMALTQSDWPLRYLSLWLVLESFFGPEDARETTFRLCQRVTLFLNGRGEGAKTMFRQLNNSYRWRSKIVHGMRLQKLDSTQSLELLETLEEWVHLAVRKVISNNYLLEVFDSSRREEYLDELALGE